MLNSQKEVLTKNEIFTTHQIQQLLKEDREKSKKILALQESNAMYLEETIFYQKKLMELCELIIRQYPEIGNPYLLVV